jgi:hypothetical protein
LHIIKNKGEIQGDSKELLEALKKSQDDLLFRIKNLESILMKRLGISTKELVISFGTVKEEIMLSSYEHEKKDFKVKLNPIIVTNE